VYIHLFSSLLAFHSYVCALMHHSRGSAANIYANSKCRAANKTIEDKELDLDFKA
jgi:hypothetical protein